jgi:hypothetical protein
MDSARTILLRRPPVLNRVGGLFVPAALPLGEVDAAWAGLVRENPRYFDGPTLHVLGVSRNGHGGVTIHVIESAYRFYAVLRQGLDSGVRPLGVKGMAQRNGAWLMGRRSASVAFYPDAWEFVPGGSMQPGVEPAQMLAQELGEESGFRLAAPPLPVALLYDPGAYTWEIVHRIEVEPSDSIDPPGWEHRELRWVRPGEEPQPLAPVAEAMLPLRAPLRGDAEAR